jgi:hypothetical protein
MVEFKVQLAESVVNTFGYQQVESYLEDFVQKMLLKAAAQEALEELSTIDLQNDEEWQAARHLAWQQEKHKYEVTQ